MNPFEEYQKIQEQIRKLQERSEEIRKEIANLKKSQCEELCRCVEQVKNLSTGHWHVVVEENGDIKIYPKTAAAERVVQAARQASGGVVVRRAGSGVLEQRVARYKELRAEHPDWTPYKVVQKMSEELGGRPTVSTILYELKHAGVYKT